MTMENNNTEIWKNVRGTSGMYQVSNTGKVKSVRFNRLLKPGIAGSGYEQVRMSINSRLYAEYTHRLVALHFLDYDENNLSSLRVNHKDLDKLNNHIDNLELITQKQNIHHFYNSEGEKPRYMRRVVQVDKEGKIVNEFASMTEAAQVTGFRPATVHKHCTGAVKRMRKWRIPYTFYFKDEYDG